MTIAMYNVCQRFVIKKSFAYLLLVCFLTLFTFSKCKKDKSSPNPASQLPAATQTGKNTLGFLLNGQPWTPAGNNGTANLSLYYDQPFRGGVFNIYAYKRLSSSGNRQSFSIASDSIQSPQKISVGMKNFVAVFRNDATNSDMLSTDSTVKTIGFCQITKLDQVNHIFSGVFTFEFIKKGLDTVRITDGRFDFKY